MNSSSIWIATWIVCLISAGGNTAWAGGKKEPITQVSSDQRFIYLKTPWRDMVDSARREVVNDTVDLLTGELAYLIPSERAAIRRISERMKITAEIEQIAIDAEKYAQVVDDGSLGLRDLFPGGFFLFTGGKFTAGLALNGGASMSIGVVVVPAQVKRINVYTRQVSSYIELDWALIGIPTVYLGGGAGAGAAFRLGAGIIWGDLRTAKDFTGLVLGASQHFTLGVGWNAKAAILHNFNIKKTFPFAAFAFEAGPGAEASINGSSSYIFPLDRVLQAVMGTEDQYLSGTQRRLDSSSNKTPEPTGAPGSEHAPPATQP